MNKIMELILSCAIGIFLYTYSNKVLKRKMVDEYKVKSSSKGTYNKDYEKVLSKYLDKKFSLIVLLGYTIIVCTNIFIGIISILIIFLLNPVPKEF